MHDAVEERVWEVLGAVEGKVVLWVGVGIVSSRPQTYFIRILS